VCTKLDIYVLFNCTVVTNTLITFLEKKHSALDIWRLCIRF